MSGRVTSIKFDNKTADLLDQLKDEYGASSKAEVLRKSIALLSLANAAENENAKLIIKGKDENGKEYEKEIIVK